MIAKATTDSVYEFPINQELMTEALKLKEEQELVKQRLNKIETNKGKVSNNVFNKVRQDYLTRFEEVTQQLLSKKQDIDKELATLYQTRDKIQKNLHLHQETLEELEFRFRLEEFSEENFKNESKNQKEKIKKFESILSGVLSNIERYEGVFGKEEESEPKSVSKKSEKPFNLDEELGLEEEEEGTDREKEFPRAAPPGWTDTTSPDLNDEPESSDTAQLIIISGPENVGKAYAIKKGLAIGRSKINQIPLSDAKASRQHAEIKAKGGDYILTDLNSSNGTFVNGEKVKEHVLSENDEIAIGDFVFEFQS